MDTATTIVLLGDSLPISQLNNLPVNITTRYVGKSLDKKRLSLSAFYILDKFLTTHLPKYHLEDIIFLANKPYFVKDGIHLPLKLSISHSGNKIAVALSFQDLGVDIEIKQAKSRNYLGLLKRYATQSELNWYLRSTNQQESFFISWCAKEAILKAYALGVNKIQCLALNKDTNTFYVKNYNINGTVTFFSMPDIYLAVFQSTDLIQQYSNLDLRKEQTIKFYIFQEDHLVPTSASTNPAEHLGTTTTEDHLVSNTARINNFFINCYTPQPLLNLQVKNIKFTEEANKETTDI